MINRYPSVRLLQGRRTTANSLSESTVEIEIYFQHKRKWISTGVKIAPKNWSKDNKVIGCANAVDLNLKIEALYNNILKYIRTLMIEEKEFTWSHFNNFIESNRTPTSFIDFVNKRYSARKDIKESTRRQHKKLYNSLKKFGKIQSFADLTKNNILLYDEWLHDLGYCQVTVACYHKFMKVYINDAIRMDMIKDSPYNNIKIDRGKSEMRKYITSEELSKLEKAKMPTDSLEKVRDLFVFQCYTGLAYADLSKFDFKQVEQKGGKYVLHDVRQKTGEDYYIVLLPKAIAVLKKYDYILPIMTNQQYNLRLKLVAGHAKVEKNLTSHMGRHTYATLCLNAGVKIEVLAHMLGHSDIKTTQIYAKLVNQTVEDAYDLLSEKLSDIGEVPEECQN